MNDNAENFKVLDTAKAQAMLSPIVPRWVATAICAAVDVLKNLERRVAAMEQRNG